TPALKAEALEVITRYRMGPLFTPPVASSIEGPLATLQVPSDVGGANWPGGSMDPENNFLYIHSHTAVFLNGLVPANPAQSDMGYVSGQARAGGAGPGATAGGRGGGGGGGGGGEPVAPGLVRRLVAVPAARARDEAARLFRVCHW